MVEEGLYLLDLATKQQAVLKPATGHRHLDGICKAVGSDLATQRSI